MSTILDGYLFIDIETSGLTRFPERGNRYPKVLEVAYAYGAGEVKSFFTPQAISLGVDIVMHHDNIVSGPDNFMDTVSFPGVRKAFEINHFPERIAQAFHKQAEESNLTFLGVADLFMEASCNALDEFKASFGKFAEANGKKPVVVGANAAHFDLPFLEDYFGEEFPIHHRIFDMGSYAAGLIGSPEPLRGWIGSPEPLSLSKIRGIFDKDLNRNKRYYPAPVNIPDGDHTAAGDVHHQRMLTAYLLGDHNFDPEHLDGTLTGHLLSQITR